MKSLCRDLRGRVIRQGCYRFQHRFPVGVGTCDEAIGEITGVVEISISAICSRNRSRAAVVLVIADQRMPTRIAT